MLKRKFVCSLCVLAVAVFLSGCSGGVGVSGKVTFPDGTPVTKGEVNFQSDKDLVSGFIAPDGTYKLEGATKGSGIPGGTYQVFIVGTQVVDSKGSPDPSKAVVTEMVAKKFASRETSGLTCDVKGATVFNITVEKP
ncbi:MAG: hypothetical protein ACRC46_15670 [Thermoguttaceae bacterium]